MYTANEKELLEKIIEMWEVTPEEQIDMNYDKSDGEAYCLLTHIRINGLADTHWSYICGLRKSVGGPLLGRSVGINLGYDLFSLSIQYYATKKNVLDQLKELRRTKC